MTRSGFTAVRLRRTVQRHVGALTWYDDGCIGSARAWLATRPSSPDVCANLGWARSYRRGDGIDACEADAMIVFDASGSMATSDYTLKLPRIAQAKQSMSKVIPEVAPLRRLGLIVYGEGAYNDCTSISLRLRPTSNAAEPLLQIIKRINPRGKTPLTQSVRQAAEVLGLYQARSRRRPHH